MLCALRTNAVEFQTANGSKNQTSGGADGRETMRGSVLEGDEGLVRLQALGKVLGALITDAVEFETASGS